VAIAVIMAGAGIGLGLHMTSGGGHASAAPPGGLAADIFPPTAPPVITRPHVTTWARTAHLASSTPRDHRRAVQAQLAATLNEIRFLGHDMSAGDERLLPALNHQAARLRAEIVRLDQRLGAVARRRPARRAPARPVRLTSITKHAPAHSGHARPSPPVASAPVGEAGRRAEAVAYAEAQLGKPYVWGGAGPYGFDCSGLVMMAWQAGGVLLAHYTGSQWADTFHIGRGQLEPGDLVFSNGFGHVQMYVGHGEVIQAPYTGQVVSYAPLPPAAQVDGYASVFPPGHLAPHGPRVGGTRHHRSRGHGRGGHRSGGRRRWRHSPRRRSGSHGHGRRSHGHGRRLRGHHRARGHHRGRRHRRTRAHQQRDHGHCRAGGHHQAEGHRRARRHRPRTQGASNPMCTRCGRSTVAER
jgi:cell wall-associated NlpC family hydrolase